jgi:hypothetical protein
VSFCVFTLLLIKRGTYLLVFAFRPSQLDLGSEMISETNKEVVNKEKVQFHFGLGAHEYVKESKQSNRSGNAL